MDIRDVQKGALFRPDMVSGIADNYNVSLELDSSEDDTP